MSEGESEQWGRIKKKMQWGENIGHRREARNRNSCQVDSGYKREDNGGEDLGEERGGQEVLLGDLKLSLEITEQRKGLIQQQGGDEWVQGGCKTEQTSSSGEQPLTLLQDTFRQITEITAILQIKIRNVHFYQCSSTLSK